MNWKIFAVLHTYWDKEWYFTKEESDINLKTNINEIIKVLAQSKEYKSFNFDGQTSFIDDYSVFYPENKNEIYKLIKEKKLIVGPWYIQPDLFNTTSESVVRNLLIGINNIRKDNLNTQSVTYVPDSFGHNNQMPQIYKSFNLDSFIFWRGMSKKQIDEYGSLFKWKGIDGTEITSYNFLLGYWPLGTFFPYKINEENNLDTLAKKFIDETVDIIEKLKSNMKQKGVLLLPIGGDQAPINKFTPQFIDKLKEYSNDEWIISNYEDFFKYVDAKNLILNSVNGEFKYPYMSRIHKTIGSNRYDIKKLLKTVEYKLYQQLEPLSILWSISGGEYPFEVIQNILKKLLLSLSHDSAGGCNSDDTNENIKNRLLRSLNLIESQTTEILKQFSYNMNLKDEEFIILNTNVNGIKNEHHIKIFSTLENFIIKNNDTNVEYDLLMRKIQNDGFIVKPTDAGESFLEAARFYEYDLIVYDGINPFEIRKYSLQKSKNVNSLTINFNNWIENKYCKIKFYSDMNKIEIIDKINENKINDLFGLSATWDAGDYYDYSPPSNNIQIISTHLYSKFEVINYGIRKTLKIKSKFSIPKKINSKIIIEQIITREISLDENNYIDLKISLINKSQNIKWILNNYLNNSIESVISNIDYATIERPAFLKESLTWKSENWVEKPIGIETNESFIAVRNENIIPVTFLTFGNNEYQADQNNLKITLFRSVDALGKHNLLWRPNRASGTSEHIINTHDSKLLNQNLKFNFRFLVGENINLWKQAKQFTTPHVFYQIQTLNNLYKKWIDFYY
ncbi:alpha-mannosidase [Spiroplasma endosymbiont of Labia minor]|uniref:glycoside hydrolase family 38 N-terminal domain-containing protein n=1 Tax=Spiroplasma endosymbiont of Labia minor TaxID=3066305 RepID=UPI0030CB570E